MHATLPLLHSTDFPAICRGDTSILQVNLGYRCNQNCRHCHVNAGPNRKEMMARKTLDLILPVLRARKIDTLDLTGGAPELHADFRHLVSEATDAGIRVIDRCNLTILFEPGQQGLAGFLAENRVEVLASLPCYSAEKVDGQRGKGAFDKSIKALRELNALGYGQPGIGLVLNLVYNPQGPSLPPNQQTLEADYKEQLRARFGIEFNQLYALANMPIKRFGSMLISRRQFHGYMTLLKEHYRADNLPRVMCRSLISVDWRGYLYDCDFNQQLGLPLAGEDRPHLRELLASSAKDKPICVADHCFGCTAGQGSSCGGAF